MFFFLLLSMIFLNISTCYPNVEYFFTPTLLVGVASKNSFIDKTVEQQR